MTKPEGPAQEPQCPMCGYTRADAQLHMDHHLCKNAGNAPWEATPTPSQPAGEPQSWRVGRKVPINVYDERGNPVCQCQTPAYAEIIVKSVNARQQTAAELKAATRRIAELEEFWRDKNEQWKAAERERDSLREANARLAADLDAALKVWKDGQK